MAYVEFLESSARPEPAAYWPSGKRWVYAVSAKEFHWSFWVEKLWKNFLAPVRERRKDHLKALGELALKLVAPCTRSCSLDLSITLCPCERELNFGIETA
jgi:hypothetical protein